MDFYANFPPASSASIRDMSLRDHVRLRPGMYIGGKDARSLHHLIYEVLDHMVEEALIGRCNDILIELRHNNEICLRDNSAGLPIGRYRDTPFTEMEVLLQDLATSKHDLEPVAYQTVGGRHGLGLAAVNYLCDRFEVENYRDGTIWRQSYAHGKPVSPVTQTCDNAPNRTGTTFVFHPDYSILDQNDFDVVRIENRAREVAFLTPGLRVEVSDIRVDPAHKAVFHYSDGLKSLIAHCNANYHSFHEPVYIYQNISIPRTGKPDLVMGIQIAFQFSAGSGSYVRTYVNTDETPEGGTHLAALKSALLSCLNGYMEYYPEEFDEHTDFTWNEIAPGLAAVVSIHHPNPQYAGATKAELGSVEVFGPIAGLVFEAFNWRHGVGKIVQHYLSRRNTLAIE